MLVRRPFVVAEDDDNYRLLIQEALAEVDSTLKVSFAEDGEKLLEILQTQVGSRTPVLLVDMKMPRLDGQELIKTLRADPEMRHIPVLVLSSYCSELDVLTAYCNGANGFFQKPLNYEELVEMLGTIVAYWGRFAMVPDLPTRH